ncbi:zinc-binding protein A33-like [Anguilla rostrata]|uniref:zinc-binding protein A33-like n=1 Tax=Anguilla rostrata TaxID=7938 RepID=UPI0030CD8EBF
MTSGEETGLAMSLVNEVTCQLCSSLYVDPVRLDCEHNYCRQCIIDYWKKGERRELGEMEEKNNSGFTCPLCCEIFPQFTLKSNKLLATIVDRMRGLGMHHHKVPLEGPRKCPSSKSALVRRGEKEGGRGLCSVHWEPLKMYCEEERIGICVVCAVSKDHRTHRLAPIEEVLTQCQENFQMVVRHFESQKDEIKKLYQKSEEEIQEIKSQSVSLQAHLIQETDHLLHCIQRERERLCSMLQRDTERLLALRQKALAHLSQETDTLTQEVTSLSARFQEEGHDPAALINDVQEVTVRIQAQFGVLDGEVKDWFDLGIYKGPIQYFLWKKLEEVIQPGLCTLTLDPATANPFLSLSNDLTTARYSHTPKEGLSMGEARFEFSPCVLAKHGFSSGRHYWEVEVGDQPDWDVGVASETAERDGWVVLSPENGYWTVGNKGVRRVGVYLDYEAGQLSFYNTEDMSSLFSFLGENFKDTLYPFFYPSADSSAQPLKLLNPRT